MLTALIYGVGYGAVALAIYWNLKDKRLFPTNEHCYVCSIVWPILIPMGALYLIFRAFHFGTKAVVVETTRSVTFVIKYQNTKLLTAKTSHGNSLAPKDEFEEQAQKEIDRLLEEA